MAALNARSRKEELDWYNDIQQLHEWMLKEGPK